MSTITEEYKKINLRSDKDKPLKIKPDEIPNLVPDEILNQWMEGDEDPYFKIQEIKYPLLANGYNYVESFFESFISKLNRAPIPGSKDGHLLEWGKRANTDLLLIGAKIEKGKKEGTGKVYFKNYIPPEGESGDNSVFIKENRSGMIDFSLVSYTKDERIENKDGSITWNVIESLGGERNDAVPYGLGAMEQKTNVADGDIENNNRETKLMSKKDTLEALKTLKTNAEITLPEVAQALGLESQLITEDQTLLLAKMNTVQKMIGEEDVIDFVTEALAFRKENAKKVREATMTEAFGPKEFEDKKENKCRTYAEKVLNGVDDLTEEKINEVKGDSLYKGFAAERADVDSPENDITGISESKKNVKTEAENKNGVRIVKM